MKINDLKRHLKPYLIVNKRATTINHAFASAVAPYELYNEKKIKKAIKTLGQDPNKDLLCVYCGNLAETWDHVYGLVKDSNFSGYGHVLGNLVPCCKNCNSKKGNIYWKDYLNQIPNSNDRIKILSKYLKKYLKLVEPSILVKDSDFRKLIKIKIQILNLMQEADAVALKIRSKIQK